MPPLTKTPLEAPESQFKVLLEDRLPMVPAKNTALSFALSCRASSKEGLLSALDAEISRLSEFIRRESGGGRKEFDSSTASVSPAEAVYGRLHQLRKARDLVDSNI